MRAKRKQGRESMKKKRKVWKIIGGVLLAIVLLLAAAVAYLTIREYRPDPIEDLSLIHI